MTRARMTLDEQEQNMALLLGALLDEVGMNQVEIGLDKLSRSKGIRTWIDEAHQTLVIQRRLPGADGPPPGP